MRKSIGGKLLAGMIILTLLLTIGVCLFISHRLEQNTVDKYEYVGQALTGTLAGMIDGDRTVAYLETREKDDYYAEVLDLVLNFADRFEPENLYICTSSEGQLQYIWSNDLEGEDTLGYTEEYPADQEAWTYSRMRGEEGEPLWFIRDPDYQYGRLAIAASPVLNAAGEPVAAVFADFSLREIESDIRQMVLSISLCVLALMAIYIAVYALYVKRNLIRPIRKLTTAAESMTDNLEANEVYHSDIHTGDELEKLSKSFEKMDGDLRRYIEDNLRITAERHRMGAELDLAAAIQNGQLPQTFPAFPDRRDFDIHASMTPARTVGGDFYDFFLVDDDHIALVIADVSGKGVPASLFMMISRILIKNRVQAGESPAQALASVNNELMENNQAALFVTVWLAVVELSTGRGVAANAGHEHPALRRSGGQYELVKYKHAAPVGILKRMKFAEHEFELHPGDSLFVYTDGVTEATSREEQLFDTERMLDALNREPEADCQRTLENVMDGIHAFVDGAEQFDDITMLCFTYFGSGSEEKRESA